MQRPPKLSQHATGVYFVKYAGKCHYFSKDKAASQREYAAWVGSVWAPLAAGKPARKSAQISLHQLAEAYLAWVLAERGAVLMGQYRSYLRLAIAMSPELPACKMSVLEVEGLKADLREKGYKPTTINHVVKALRRMLAWGQKRGLLVAHDLSDVAAEAKVSSPPKALTGQQLHTILSKVLEKDPRLLPWLAVCYLSCARPSEVVRLAHGQGQWMGKHVFACQNKVWRKTDKPRYLLISQEAREDWLPLLKPHWKAWTSFSERCRVVSGEGGPRKLRTAGATHLRQAGVGYTDIRLILGHGVRGETGRYVAEDFATVVPLLDRLTLRSVTVPAS